MRVCQDIVLKAIARSNLGRNVTIKDGVVMRSITWPRFNRHPQKFIIMLLKGCCSQALPRSQ